jgi:hypothetical protein
VDDGMTSASTANAAELVLSACVVQASRHETLSKRGLRSRAQIGHRLRVLIKKRQSPCVAE